MSTFINNALASAHKYMDSEKKSSVGTSSDFTPKPAAKPQAEKSDYSHPREARKSSEFMGVRSDEAPDIKSGLDAREAAKKALVQ